MFIYFSPLIPFFFPCKLNNLNACCSDSRNTLLYMFINILHNWCCTSHLIPDKNQSFSEVADYLCSWGAHHHSNKEPTHNLELGKMLIHCFSKGPNTIHIPFYKLDKMPAKGVSQQPEHVQDKAEMVCRGSKIP